MPADRAAAPPTSQPGTSRPLVCRFVPAAGGMARVGAALGDATIADLTAAGVDSLGGLLDGPAPAAAVAALLPAVPTLALADVHLLPPVEMQEVWAAGVTYLRSKTARMEESDFSASAYDRVYDADRPEIFFKSIADKVVGTGDAVGIRSDARWNVPEPELALVMNGRGAIVGCAVGNDMSSRDIEGENLLYLPQAKTYDRSCALGPWVALETDEALIRRWTIAIGIARAGKTVFAGETRVDQIKRRFDELAAWLWRSQRFPHGVVLLTGTGIVPDESFTLLPGDRVTIRVDGVGTLENTVITV
ncbi:MAG: fumarylacetoacetate hydrolase family protein [Planctomycetaceae bacterium]